VLQVYFGQKDGIDFVSLLSLQACLGIGIIFGSLVFGTLVVKNHEDCNISRQNLFQSSSFLISISILAFLIVDDYGGYLIFVCIYGFFFGGYQYTLKMYVYKKVKAKNFNQTWSLIQCVQAIPLLTGVTITGN